jgi:hypothetical protein
MKISPLSLHLNIAFLENYVDIVELKIGLYSITLYCSQQWLIAIRKYVAAFKSNYSCAMNYITS